MALGDGRISQGGTLVAFSGSGDGRISQGGVLVVYLSPSGIVPSSIHQYPRITPRISARVLPLGSTQVAA